MQVGKGLYVQTSFTRWRKSFAESNFDLVKLAANQHSAVVYLRSQPEREVMEVAPRGRIEPMPRLFNQHKLVLYCIKRP